MSEIDQHIEAIRSIFKKSFSGNFTYFDGSKSMDILKEKDDVEKNFDWDVCGDELDKFSEELHSYFNEKKIDKKIIEDLIKKFENSSLNIDKRISVEIQRIVDDQYLES